MSIPPDALPKQILSVRAAFLEEGEDLRAVGGCVRDILLGEAPKDFDFCTTADPYKQIAIYVKHGIRHIATGLKHGTVTIVVEGETFEITSLRTESEHDGRHATVAYTRDWTEDASRRDLTINAMSLEFDGTLHDPFGGREDLQRGRVRFVGDPAERMREDYLRILRFLRFHARFAVGRPLDTDAEEAILRVGRGLKDISAERIWSEVSRTIRLPGGPWAIEHMLRLKITPFIGMFSGSWREMQEVQQATSNPVTLMVAYLLDEGRTEKQATNWKWSTAERDLGLFLARRQHDRRSDYHRLIAEEGFSRAWVFELACLHRAWKQAAELDTWEAPVFPLRGQDLIDAGMKPGPAVGHLLDVLKSQWADEGFRPTKADLLNDPLVALALRPKVTETV